MNTDFQEQNKGLGSHGKESAKLSRMKSLETYRFLVLPSFSEFWFLTLLTRLGLKLEFLL
jgi:hypothetical protein